MKKKLLATLLCAALTVTALAGCGGGSAGTESSGTQAEQTETETAQAESPAETSGDEEEVEIYMFISSPEYADAINALIAEYKNVKPNVTINYETTQNDYPTMLKAKLNAGECPDIFASTAGKEIETYKEYSYDLTGQPVQEALLPAIQASMVDASGNGCYGFHYVGDQYGIIYNQDCLDAAGVTSLPTTLDELEECCEKLQAAGIQPFACGWAEWWVFKQSLIPFLTESVDNYAAFVSDMESGADSLNNHEMMNDNMFRFVDIVKANCESKPLESDLASMQAALATGKAAMGLGMGPWAEASLLAINPEMNINYGGYPVSDDPAQCQIAAGASQALRVNKDSEHLQEVLDFINWWFTSDFGRNWLSVTVGGVPSIDTDGVYSSVMVQLSMENMEANGAGNVGTTYSSDAFWQSFGESFQSYVEGSASREDTIAKIEKDWQEIDGADQ
ncbi:MAG: extracellular solute-binding protein [Lachnospiraceae bacterium]|nr:extracellular solute-binding protein [Lachnospiraceae bacterium]